MSGHNIYMEGNNLYHKIISLDNLILAWQKARKGKTKKDYVIEFEKNTEKNLLDLHFELKDETYYPKPLKTFILRDPKTRKISKSAFRDRIVHHAICNILEPIFDKTFIYDSCANRKGKGNLFALKRFDKFQRKITKNLTKDAFCLKADIKHYFQEVNHEVLLNIMKRKIADSLTINLIEKIVANSKIKKTIYLRFLDAQDSVKNLDMKREINIWLSSQNRKGMPLGNLTSQFFANIYLNELDYFVKYQLKAKYYIRYVDDFVILHNSKEQLEEWKAQINNFLNNQLKIELHPDKSRIIQLSRGIDFVGFRNFYHFKLLRKRNIRKMCLKIAIFSQGKISYRSLMESFQGWNAYARWANTFKLRKNILKEIHKVKHLY